MGDKSRKSHHRRNYVAKKLWEDGRFRHKVNTKALEVRRYEEEDGRQEIQDYLRDSYTAPGND